MGISLGYSMIYPLVDCPITMENHRYSFLPEGSINKGGIMRLYGESASSGVIKRWEITVPGTLW
jgi:hypothetical protein